MTDKFQRQNYTRTDKNLISKFFGFSFACCLGIFNSQKPFNIGVVKIVERFKVFIKLEICITFQSHGKKNKKIVLLNIKNRFKSKRHYFKAQPGWSRVRRR